MSKIVLAAASGYNEKYFINEEFLILPKEVLNTVKKICICTALKTRGIFIMGFYSDGTVFFQTKGEEIGQYDEIGAQLEIKRLMSEEREFINSLQLWYVTFKTKKGREINKKIIKAKT